MKKTHFSIYSYQLTDDNGVALYARPMKFGYSEPLPKEDCVKEAKECGKSNALFHAVGSDVYSTIGGRIRRNPAH